MSMIKLGEVLQIQHGYAFKSKEYVEKSNYRLVTLGNFEEGNNSFKYNDAKATYYGADFPEEYVLQTGDLVMPLTEQVVGLFGNSAFIPKEEQFHFVLNQRVGKVICNENRLDKIYAHYLLATNSVKKQLEARASGTRQRNISPNDVYDVTVELPSLDIQKTVGKILFNIEQKQELNNSICLDLESMAKTIYDYWFLQFEFPNEEGKPYKSSGGKMVWNDELKREIPEGWKVKNISDLCTLGNGINYDKKVTGDKSYKIVNVRDISASSLLINKQDMNEISLPSVLANKYLVNKDDILIARSGTPGAVRLVLDTENVIYCGFIIHCLPNDLKDRFYLTFTLKRYEGTSATKTGGSIFQNVSQDTLKSLIIPLPSKNVLLSFNAKLKPLIDKMQLCIEENNQLASLRDFLLPLLMNGQVTFKEEDE